MDRLTLLRPDDWHIHLRDNHFLPVTVADAQRNFARAIVMPNLQPPVTTCSAVLGYHARIMAQLDNKARFTPLMTLYLTDNTHPSEIYTASESELIYAVKYYPAGATTNSDSGVTDLEKCTAVLEAMEETGLPLLLHGEVTTPGVDIFDREQVFIDTQLSPLLAKFPSLKVVMEHITTAQAADFVRDAPENVGATITPQHLMFNRNDLFVGGIRPHLYCLPILKRNQHQQALLKAATSGNPKFFLGTDSAPHIQSAKETACGCAGCYSAPAAIELYAEVFDEMGALDKLEGFASQYGADFYGLPRNSEQITLIKEPWQVPRQISVGTEQLIPLFAGETLNWKLLGAC